jgi:hypothetical protein
MSDESRYPRSMRVALHLAVLALGLGATACVGTATVDAGLASRVPAIHPTFARGQDGDMASISFGDYTVTDVTLLHGVAPGRPEPELDHRFTQLAFALHEPDKTEWWAHCWTTGDRWAEERDLVDWLPGRRGWTYTLWLAAAGMTCTAYHPENPALAPWDLTFSSSGDATFLDATDLDGMAAERADLTLDSADGIVKTGLEIHGSGQVWNVWGLAPGGIIRETWAARSIEPRGAGPAVAALALADPSAVWLDPSLTGDARTGAALVMAAGLAAGADVKHHALHAVDTGGGAAVTPTQISLAGETGCARMSDGTVRCWTAPDKVYDPGMHDVARVAAATYYGCGVRTDGRAVCWPAPGTSAPGPALGDGTNKNWREPTLVFGPTGLVDVVASGSHACARSQTGMVYCWGDTGEWLRGFPVELPVAWPPAAGAAGLSIYAYGDAGCTALVAVMPDGTARAAAKSTHVECIDSMARMPLTTVAVSDVTDVRLGRLFGVALKRDGTVSVWGNLELAHAPDVGSLHDIVQIAAGQEHACALDRGGTVYCWGHNPAGQIGDGPDDEQGRSVPVQVLTNANQIAADGSDTCAVGNDGTLRCWGAYNIDDEMYRPTPIVLSATGRSD